MKERETERIHEAEKGNEQQYKAPYLLDKTMY